MRRVARTGRPARRLPGGAGQSGDPRGDHPLDAPAEPLAESPAAAPRRAARASQVHDLSARAAGEPGEAAPVARRSADGDSTRRVPGGGPDDARRYRRDLSPGSPGDRPGVRPRSRLRAAVRMEAPPGARPRTPPEEPVAFGWTATRLSPPSGRRAIIRTRSRGARLTSMVMPRRAAAESPRRVVRIIFNSRLPGATRLGDGGGVSMAPPGAGPYIHARRALPEVCPAAGAGNVWDDGASGWPESAASQRGSTGARNPASPSVPRWSPVPVFFSDCSAPSSS